MALMQVNADTAIPPTEDLVYQPYFRNVGGALPGPVVHYPQHFWTISFQKMP